MALETLKNVKEIGGYPVGDANSDDHDDIVTGADWNEYEKTHPIWVDHIRGWLMFKMQTAPIKEVGVNGCQVDTLIEAAKKILEGLNEKLPSAYNDNAINKLEMALYWLKQRTIDREARGVEGTNNG